MNDTGSALQSEVYPVYMDLFTQFLVSVQPDGTWWSTNGPWARALLIALAAQAVIGFLSLEWAFHRLSRVRDGDEARDSQFPAFRRRDVKHWARWKFYPGAMLLMPTRFILLTIDGIFLTLIIR